MTTWTNILVIVSFTTLAQSATLSRSGNDGYDPGEMEDALIEFFVIVDKNNNSYVTQDEVKAFYENDAYLEGPTQEQLNLLIPTGEKGATLETFLNNYAAVDPMVKKDPDSSDPAESSLTGLFYTMDTNEDKKLTQDEFKAFFKDVPDNEGPTQEELDLLIPAEHEGGVDLETFIANYADVKAIVEQGPDDSDTANDPESIFKMLDKDEDNILTQEELKAYFATVDIMHTQEQIDMLVPAGGVSLETFTANLNGAMTQVSV